MRFIHDIYSMTSMVQSRYPPVDLQAEEEGWCWQASPWKLWGLLGRRNVRTPKFSKKRPSPFGHICMQNICMHRQTHAEIYSYTHTHLRTHGHTYTNNTRKSELLKQINTHMYNCNISVQNIDTRINLCTHLHASKFPMCMQIDLDQMLE